MPLCLPVRIQSKAAPPLTGAPRRNPQATRRAAWTAEYYICHFLTGVYIDI
jgi:hypothetical protein